MGLFGAIINGLFGIEKRVEIKGVGIVTCKVCSWHQKKRYTWSGNIRLSSYPESTLFFIEGNSNGPDARQEASLRRLVGDWNRVIDRLNCMLPDECRKENKTDPYMYWQERFFPEMIMPGSRYSDFWDITFNGTDDFQEEYFSFIWQNEDVKELAIG